MDDQTLMAAAQRGERWACEAFVERYQGPVRALARRLAPDASHADDLAQEAFLHALRGLESFRGEGSPVAWLRGIVRNQSRGLWRRLARRGGVERDGLAVYIEHIACDELPLDPLECDERRQALQGCLDQLDERGRRLLDLRHRHELPCEEIGVAVSAKAGAVRTALCRLHKRLRNCLERRLGGAGA